MIRRNAAPGTLQVTQRIVRVLRSILKASPKLLSMKAMLLLSGEISARSPKWVRTSIWGGRCSSGLPDFLWAKVEQGRTRQASVSGQRFIMEGLSPKFFESAGQRSKA